MWGTSRVELRRTQAPTGTRHFNHYCGFWCSAYHHLFPIPCTFILLLPELHSYTLAPVTTLTPFMLTRLLLSFGDPRPVTISGVR